MRNILLITVLISIIAGCSSKSSPLLNSYGVFDNSEIGVSNWDSEGKPAAGMGILGQFDLHIDPLNQSAELTSLRTSALTDVLEIVDITNFLAMAPCSDCVKIQSVSMDTDENLVVSIGIKHPFGAGDPLKPISGQNRADLHVFNVEGMVVSNSTGTDFSGIGQSSAGFLLLSADGYSGYLDGSLDGFYPTDATIHPYITHFDDYSAGNFDASNPMGFQSVTTPPPSGNLVMPMGSDYDFQDYVFNLAVPMDFIFAVGCTYAVSAASKSDRFTPEYRIPQHNKKSASEVSIEIISNNLADGDTGSTADIEVRIVDISHAVATGVNLDEMLTDSSVDDILIEIPGITVSPIIIDGNNSSGGTGHDPADPLVYNAVITNDAGGAEGSYFGLIKVTDTYLTGQNTSLLLNGMDGIKRVEPIENPLGGLFEITEFATCQVFTIDVLLTNEDPVADAVVTGQAYNAGMAEITFDATGSYDTDGTVDLYEWDFNDDGLFDDTGDEYTGEPWNPTHSFEAGNCYDVQLRVTDNALATDELDVPLIVCPFKNIPLREGVNISDVGTIMNTEEILVMFDDHQVWKYDRDLNNGALLYTMPESNKLERRIACSKNGDSICGWWDASGNHTYSYYADGTMAHDHWLTFDEPPFNIDVTVTHATTGWVPIGTHNTITMFQPVGGPTILRAGWGGPAYDGWYSNYNTDNGPGPGRIDLNYLKGFQGLSSSAFWCLFFLEGDPEYRVEFCYILFGFGAGWGGNHSDADDGFWDPRDITSDSSDILYIVDVLSDGTPKIKKFTTTGTSLGSFGDNTTMAQEPVRIDGSFSNDWLYVTMDDTISIFFPNEQP